MICYFTIIALFLVCVVLTVCWLIDRNKICKRLNALKDVKKRRELYPPHIVDIVDYVENWKDNDEVRWPAFYSIVSIDNGVKRNNGKKMALLPNKKMIYGSNFYTVHEYDLSRDGRYVIYATSYDGEYSYRVTVTGRILEHELNHANVRTR